MANIAPRLIPVTNYTVLNSLLLTDNRIVKHSPQRGYVIYSLPEAGIKIYLRSSTSAWVSCDPIISLAELL